MLKQCLLRLKELHKFCKKNKKHRLVKRLDGYCYNVLLNYQERLIVCMSERYYPYYTSFSTRHNNPLS